MLLVIHSIESFILCTKKTLWGIRLRIRQDIETNENEKRMKGRKKTRKKERERKKSRLDCKKERTE